MSWQCSTSWSGERERGVVWGKQGGSVCCVFVSVSGSVLCVREAGRERVLCVGIETKHVCVRRVVWCGGDGGVGVAAIDVSCSSWRSRTVSNAHIWANVLTTDTHATCCSVFPA